jgi:hypothetical protein
MNFIVNNSFNFELILEKKDDEIQAEELCDYTDEDDSVINSLSPTQLKEKEKKYYKKFSKCNELCSKYAQLSSKYSKRSSKYRNRLLELVIEKEQELKNKEGKKNQKNKFRKKNKIIY